MQIYGVRYDNGEEWSDHYTELKAFFTSAELAQEYCDNKSKEWEFEKAEKIEVGFIIYCERTWKVETVELEGAKMWTMEQILPLCELAFNRVIRLPHDTTIFQEWVKALGLNKHLIK